MKKLITKKLSAFIIMMMFSFTFVNAQTCTGNKVWACRTSNCVQECKCINANNVTQWQANGQPCQGQICNCLVRPVPFACGQICGFKISSSENDMPFMAFNLAPNPVSQSATISFSLSQKEKVSLKIFDMTGRIVKTLADGLFNEGENKIEWNVENEKTGIYFLRMEAGGYSHTKKLSVIQ